MSGIFALFSSKRYNMTYQTFRKKNAAATFLDKACNQIAGLL